MLRVRAVDHVDEFVGLPGDPEGYAQAVTELWDSGASKPGWCFVLEDDAMRVGRVGFRVAPTTTDPRWLGALPPLESFLFGLYVPWASDHVGAGRRLLREAAAAIRDHVPELLEVRFNHEADPHASARCRLMEACGLELFQEKQGFSWNDDGEPIAVADRLVFRSMAEVGEDAYRSVMAPCGQGTLDRNDRYYWQGCGPDNWAAQMTAFCEEQDAPLWLIGEIRNSPVGYVAVSRHPDWGSTIAHVGVVPRQRGNGYIHDLLAAGTRAAQQVGIDAMHSDVDVLNRPMIDAMRRAGHREELRDWHLWVYRGHTSQIGERMQGDEAGRPRW